MRTCQNNSAILYSSAYGLDIRDIVTQFLASTRYFLCQSVQPILVPNQPPAHWVLGDAFSGSDRDVKSVTQLYLVLKLRMCGAILPVPPYVFMA